MAFTGNKPGYIPGPRQPQVVHPHDETTHAERERALLIVADVAERVKRGQYPADDALAVLGWCSGGGGMAHKKTPPPTT